MDFALDGWVIEILEHFGNLMEYLKDCEKKAKPTDLERSKIEYSKKKLLEEIQKIHDRSGKNKR